VGRHRGAAGRAVPASRPFHGLGHVRTNLKRSTALRSGVVLPTYEPVSVATYVGGGH
jgi:hypothetical protein